MEKVKGQNDGHNAEGNFGFDFSFVTPWPLGCLSAYLPTCLLPVPYFGWNASPPWGENLVSAASSAWAAAGTGTTVLKRMSSGGTLRP